MKRGGPLQRRTPLKSSKPMKAGRALERKPFDRRTPIKAKRDSPRRTVSRKHGRMVWADVRLIIFARALGRCEICGRQLNIHNMEAHHRRTRRLGPDCPCNALALCSDCHHRRVHGQPEEARDLRGWIISRHSEDPPAEVPVELTAGWVLLACDGTVEAA